MNICSSFNRQICFLHFQKRGPQRSVDIIVSAAFIVTLLLLAFLSVEWLKDSVHLHSHLNLEALMWSASIGIFLLRFMTLGNKIHHKYRSVSVLITEQINLYLQVRIVFYLLNLTPTIRIANVFRKRYSSIEFEYVLENVSNSNKSQFKLNTILHK